MQIFYRFINSRNEWCYYVDSPTNIDLSIILPDVSSISYLSGKVYEVGPKLNFCTSWGACAKTILAKSGINVNRIERTRRSKDRIRVWDRLTEQLYEGGITDFTTDKIPNEVHVILLRELETFNEANNLNWDEADIEFYKSLFRDRDPTNVELLDLAQSNSEHSRHHFFRGKHVIDGVEMPHTLFELIKGTLPRESNSRLAFCDNASAIQGYYTEEYVRGKPDVWSVYVKKTRLYHPTLTAETHNFPTGIAPFPGAATGVGGRIRDTLAIGSGGKMVAGTVGYCVADKNLLIKASNGASDYANKIGEPLLTGFTRYYKTDDWAWIKPIMFSGGIGTVANEYLYKNPPVKGLMIVRLGGPAYRIGIGGSTASSASQGGGNVENAVQRGDPQMGNRLVSVIHSLVEADVNPILSIHDQGAGGTANVTKEIVEPLGGLVDISKITSGDETLTALEKWIAEYQEQVTILIDPIFEEMTRSIANRENLDMTVFGVVGDDGHIRVVDGNAEIVNLNLEKIFNTPVKIYRDKSLIEKPSVFGGYKLSELVKTRSLNSLIQDVFRLESVGSKRFLVNKIDRSVGGLVVQQPGVGPFDTPVADYGLVAHSYTCLTGTVTAIGEQPIKALIDPAKAGQLAVVESITNLIFTRIEKLCNVKASVNWMWPAKLVGENAAMYQCMEALSEYMKKIGISADGGKDSISMYTRTDRKIVKSPRSVVVSTYASVPDITKRVTPALKGHGRIFHIPLSTDYTFGGTAISQVLNTEFDEIAVPDPAYLCKVFTLIQDCLQADLLSAGHDISDGGLITALIEMAMAGDIPVKIELNQPLLKEWLFSETPGLLVEVPNDNITAFLKAAAYRDVNAVEIGGYKYKIKNYWGNCVEIYNYGEIVEKLNLSTCRNYWEEVSFQYECKQSSPIFAQAELRYLTRGSVTHWNWSPPQNIEKGLYIPRVAILRDEGSNGAKEMAAAFIEAGFEAWDVKMSDVLNEPHILKTYRGIAFVGGFTYADVFGAATGWATTIKNNSDVWASFEDFKGRDDTFSFGVCNGCQLMSQIGWIPTCKFTRNKSGKFESRLSTVRIGTTNSIMLQGLEDMVFGVWVAHGEGRFQGRLPNRCKAVQYVDEHRQATKRYPQNPSGSYKGICGVSSINGRHLAMMPHPERCWRSWQMWTPHSFKGEYTPWFYLFTNAYKFCREKN